MNSNQSITYESLVKELNETQLSVLNNDLEQMKQKVKSWIQGQPDCKIICITSGGTSVPIEKKTVRMIENFSSGTRGSISAELMAKKGYKIVYLYRNRSLKPFIRKYETSAIFENGITPQLQKDIEEYNQYKDSIHFFPYVTVMDYLCALWKVSEFFNTLEKPENTILYLASAVSDFYIPAENMSEHKIQSKEFKDSGISIHLENVPKLLASVKALSPKSYVISFKLETDREIFDTKIDESFKKYGMDMIIGNLLDFIRSEIFVFYKDKDGKIKKEHITVDPKDVIIEEPLINIVDGVINMK